MTTVVSISLDEEHVEWIDQNYENRSGAIRNLIEAARNGAGAAEDAVREFHIQQLEADLRRQQLQVEATQERLETMRSLEQAANETDGAELEEARDVLSGVPKEPDNPAIQNWADDLNMTPEELIQEL